MVVLRHRAEYIDAGRDYAEQGRAFGQVAQSLGEQFRQRHRHRVERGGDRDHHDQQRHDHPPHVLLRDPGLRRRLLRAAAVLVNHAPGEQHADQDGDDARNDEGKAPTEILPDHAGDQRRRRHAEVAPDAVEAHLAAELAGIGHDHGGADRMVDRGEQADRQQRGAELEPGLHQPDRDHRQQRWRQRKSPSCGARLQRSPSQPVSSEPAPKAMKPGVA